MIDSTRERDPVEMLADEFASRCREGEFPSIAEYAAKYPEYAGRIEELFPTVAMMEQLLASTRRVGFANPPEHIGDFDIAREIGRGGMGIVYEAEQRSLERPVAVKVLPKHVLLLDKHLKRFQREAQTAAKLRHTNIVPVYGVGDHDGLHYYVMPLVRGIGLDEVIRELRAVDTSDRDINRVVPQLVADKFPTTAVESTKGNSKQSSTDGATSRARRPSIQPSARSSNAKGTPKGSVLQADAPYPRLPASHWRVVAQIGVQAAEALEHAHARGTLHRDIKPGNLLVDADGVVCVADFGLARAVDHSDISRSGEVVGTLRYMAPEQTQGVADARSDTYALGLTLYELMILRPAFEDTDLRRRHNGKPARSEPAQPRKINRTIPQDLETIVLKCLAHEPTRRYQSAAALAADLRRFLDDRPIHARRTSSVERVWRWCRRNPALAAMSALATMLLIAVTVTVVAGIIQTRKAYDEASKAYADAKRSLNRAEATSQLAMDALDDIYLQLSPDRVRKSSEADPGAAARQLHDQTAQVRASNETALVLENLLVFYDRLAEEVPGDSKVMIQSAIASRRVGDIRQHLGQLGRAEREYTRAVEKLKALIAWPEPDITILTELARTHNQIGNVRSARLEHRRAYESHVQAFSILQSVESTDESTDRYHHELARTLYFLAGKRLGGFSGRRIDDARENAAGTGPHHYKSKEYRDQAISILEDLTRQNPDIPDYRLLLALCHRVSGVGPAPCRDTAALRGRRQAIQILEELKSQHPNVADYRHKLATTYAWIQVGLYPWEEDSEVSAEAEEDLLKAIDESRWLVAHNPSIPEHALSLAFILAKLGTVCRRNERLADAESFFQTALETQSKVVADFPELPSHNQVLQEFMRLRLAQVQLERDTNTNDTSSLGEFSELLERCIRNLTKLTAKPELAEDGLAWSSLSAGYRTLSHILTELGENERAEEARKNGAAIHKRTVDRRRHHRRQ